MGGATYYWHAGVYFSTAPRGYVVVGPPVVAVLPAGYVHVVIGGVPYYRCGDVYYVQRPEGYVVVPEPTVTVVHTAQVAPQATPPAPPAPAPQPAPPTPKTYTVHIRDVVGRYVPVVLTVVEGGYIGPQGEFYAKMPSVELLSALYAVPWQRQTSYTIYVPCADGAYEPVTLRVVEGGYIGPQGEFYPNMPSVAQLKAMYADRQQAPDKPAPAAEK